MSGSEAATKYKSFLNTAASAGQKLGLTFLDTNNQLMSMPDILEQLRGKYGDTLDAMEKQELKEAFGTDEAIALIDLLYQNTDQLKSGIDDVSASMSQGVSVTEDMANAINNTPEQKFVNIKQKLQNVTEELGNGLLPTVNNAMDTVYCVFQDKDAVNYLYEFTKEDDVWQLSKVETRQDEGKYSETQQSYADYEQQLLGA